MVPDLRFQVGTKKMVKMSLGDRIKQLRLLKNNISQSDFGKIIGTSQSAVQSWESNKSLPGADFLFKIKQEFGIDINWLLTGEGEQYPDSEINIGGFVRKPVVEYQVGDDPFARSVSGLRQIFESRDQALIAAIQINIQSFQLSIQKDLKLKQQSLEIQKLKEECEDLKKRIAALEEKKDITRLGPAEEVIERKAT